MHNYKKEKRVKKKEKGCSMTIQSLYIKIRREKDAFCLTKQGNSLNYKTVQGFLVPFHSLLYAYII